MSDQSKCSDWFEDLIRAIIKSNILILCNNTSCLDESTKKYYELVNIEDFIHKCYIECAREMFNSPYLLYHKLSAVEIKRNQRDCCNLVKESIREAIRKILPVKYILNQYLTNEFHNKILDNKNNDCEKQLPDDKQIFSPNIKLSNNSNTNLQDIKPVKRNIMSSQEIRNLKHITDEMLITSDILDDNIKCSNIKKDIFGYLSDDEFTDIINDKLQSLTHITDGKNKSSSVSIHKLKLENNKSDKIYKPIESNKHTKSIDYDRENISIESNKKTRSIESNKHTKSIESNRETESIESNKPTRFIASDRRTRSIASNIGTKSITYDRETKSIESNKHTRSIDSDRGTKLSNDKYINIKLDDNNDNDNDSESTICYETNEQNYAEVYSNANFFKKYSER